MSDEDYVYDEASGEWMPASEFAARQAAEERFAKDKERQRAEAEANWNAAPMSWERIGYELEQGLMEDAVVVSELDSRIPYRWLDFRPGKKRLIGQTTKETGHGLNVEAGFCQGSNTDTVGFFFVAAGIVDLPLG